MPRLLGNSIRENLVEKVESLTPQELFDLCDQRTKDRLAADFAASLDADDVEELLFCVIDGNAERVSDLSLKYSKNWDSWLEQRDLLNTYHDEISSAWLEAHEGEEE